MSAGDDPRQVHFSPEELKIAVEEATRRGVPVMAHAHSTEGIKQAVLAGVRSIEHGTFVDKETIQLMIERETFLIPTIYIRDYFLEEWSNSAALSKAVDLVRQAKKQGVQVTCEVMPHHFILTEEAVAKYDTNAKMSPPLRTQQDVDAMLKGLQDGTIDVIATDHAPHSREEKEVEFTKAPMGIVGLETALGLVLTSLVEPGILTLPQAICKMTKKPAGILNLERGELKIGAPRNPRQS